MDFDIKFGEATVLLQQYIDIHKPSKVAILLDENTYRFCLPLLPIHFDKIILIKVGESQKSIESLQQIWESMQEAILDKKSLLVNLGGGMVSDIGGFAASTFKRGIPFINIPTTLLAQVDASVGGKNGINLHDVKNVIGTFSNPVTTIIDPIFLNTLPILEYRNGKAEMIKHALIGDKSHWEYMLQYPDGDWKSLIAGSIEIKKNIVTQDFREQHTRKSLNFGHTIGHAIESLSLQTHNPLRHGEAIAIGMICESHLSTILSSLTIPDFENIKYLLSNIYPDIFPLSISRSKFFEYILHDKKNTEAGINFTLLETIGKCSIDHYLNETMVSSTMEKVGIIFTK